MSREVILLPVQYHHSWIDSHMYVQVHTKTASHSRQVRKKNYLNLEKYSNFHFSVLTKAFDMKTLF